MSLSEIDTLRSTSDSLETKRFDKRLVFGILGVAAIALTFWGSSRYPALDEKASLGGDNDISALAFDQIVQVTSSDSVLWKITGNALNWAYTNKQGMFFGILFAAAIMTLLQLLVNKQFKGRFANTLLGVSIGAPLGVCVNCAVPIAMGVQKSGARTETTLAVLLSSPSLNMVVLGMTFAVFPFWLAALKVSITLAFIILMIPLAVKMFGPENEPDDENIDTILDIAPTLKGRNNPSKQLYATHDPADKTVWSTAAGWYLRGFTANLWYIVKMTVPLMIVAGILGSIVVTLLPWDTLAAIVPTQGLAWGIGILLVAFLGTFLPVPIAFDIVICAVLLTAGVDPTYVGVLLVTLGLFSIYPALQIGHTISRKLALGLFGMVALTGVITGLTANVLNSWEIERQKTAIVESLTRNNNPMVQVKAAEGINSANIVSLLSEGSVGPGQAVLSSAENIEITKWLFEQSPTPSGSIDPLFSMKYGPELGIYMADGVSPLRFLEPIARTHSISTGDIHGDGWPDIVLTSDDGLALYANVAGERFARQNIDMPGIESRNATRVAMVDLDGDGDLDLIVGTHWEGVFKIENTDGRFETPARKLPGHIEGAIVSAFAFADIDRDGSLEIIVGNSAIGNNLSDRTSSVAQNYILSRTTGQWKVEPLSGPEGETLSILTSDLNRDGWPDLMIGNDYRPPDHLYFSDGKGQLKPVNPGMIKGGVTRWTMSLATADIDGDLIPELYAGNISGRASAKPRNPDQECRFESPVEKQNCRERLETLAPLLPARRQGDAIGCQGISDDYLAEGCAVTAMTQSVMRRGGTGEEAVGNLCDRIPARWPDFLKMCETRKDELLEPLTGTELKTTLSSRKQTNTLFKRMKNGRLEDVAHTLGVENGGWTWNARFADIDNDTDQDLYVVNGHSIAVNRYEHKLFRNESSGFKNMVEEMGIASGVPATAYSYVDFDRDGDLDIITLPTTGPAKIFSNRSDATENKSISFSLRDETKNPFGLGAEVTIRYEGGAQMHELQASGGFASFDEPILHFGLGNIGSINSVEILWPDGTETLIETPLAAGARYQIRRK